MGDEREHGGVTKRWKSTHPHETPVDRHRRTSWRTRRHVFCIMSSDIMLLERGPCVHRESCARSPHVVHRAGRLVRRVDFGWWICRPFVHRWHYINQRWRLDVSKVELIVIIERSRSQVPVVMNARPADKGGFWRAGFEQRTRHLSRSQCTIG